MIIGISPVYIKLTRRFINNVGPKSLNAISHDTSISIDKLKDFTKRGNLDPYDIMTLWNTLFPNVSFLEASSWMDAQNFKR